MPVDARLKATGLKTIRGALERLQREGVNNWQDIAARELVNEIKRTAPKDTGKYARQWKVDRRKNRTKFKTVIHISPGKKKLPGVNYDGSNYSDLYKWLEFGTKPHMIYPRKAMMLSWVDKRSGIRRFAKSVHHPGTTAQPHVRPAMRRILPRSMQNIIKGIRNKHIWIKR